MEWNGIVFHAVLARFIIARSCEVTWFLRALSYIDDSKTVYPGGRSHAGMVASNPSGKMAVCCECCV